MDKFRAAILTKIHYLSMKLNGRSIQTLKGALALDGYQYKSTLGQGRFGHCFLVSRNGNECVLKIFKANDIKRRKQKIACESRYLKGLKHSALPRFVQVFDKDGFYGFIMEKKSGLSLDEIMDLIGDFSKSEIILIMCQLIEAVEYLYNSNITHRDIKTTNILWDGKRLSLIDFGSARNCFYLKNRYDPDIWAMGDVFLRMLLNSSNTKIGCTNGLLYQLDLSEKENILLQRMLYILKPYNSIAELKQEFNRTFCIT